VRQVDDIRRMVDEFLALCTDAEAGHGRQDVAETVRQAVFLMRVGHPEIDIEAEIKDEPFGRSSTTLISQALTTSSERDRSDRGGSGRDPGQGSHYVIAARDNEDIVIDVIDNGSAAERSRRGCSSPMSPRGKRHGLGLAIVGPRAGGPMAPDRTEGCR